jgi:hypothetical protein
MLKNALSSFALRTSEGRNRFFLYLRHLCSDPGGFGALRGSAGADWDEGKKVWKKYGMFSRNTTISLMLSKRDFVNLYKACEDRKEKLDRIQRESADEDEVADAGNDLIEINMLLREPKDKADETWGMSGWTTSDEYL